MARINLHRRLFSENYAIRVPLGEGIHEFTLTIGRDKNDVPREVAFGHRGKSGQGFDQVLVQLGIQISRALQRRDPETGKPT
jgi:hypothetical protein